MEVNCYTLFTKSTKKGRINTKEIIYSDFIFYFANGIPKE